MKAATAARGKSVEARRRENFLAMLKAAHVQEPVREYEFHPTRQWKFDFAWVEYKVALESDGGAWVGGRHVTGTGYAEDIEKRNAANLLGWHVYHVLSTNLCKGDTVVLVRKAIIASLG